MWLVWTIWTSMSAVLKKAVNLNHSLTGLVPWTNVDLSEMFCVPENYFKRSAYERRVHFTIKPLKITITSHVGHWVHVINQIRGTYRVTGNMTYSQIMYCICDTCILANIFMLVKGLIGTSLPNMFVNMITQSRWSADWKILPENSICNALKWYRTWAILGIIYMLTKDLHVFSSDEITNMITRSELTWVLIYNTHFTWNHVHGHACNCMYTYIILHRLTQSHLDFCQINSLT